VQSRVVVIASVPDIPVAGAVLPASVATETSHFSADGAVVEIDVDEPAQAAARTESAHSANSRARTAVSTVQAVCRLFLIRWGAPGSVFAPI
jgi:hypothetical protein